MTSVFDTLQNKTQAPDELKKQLQELDAQPKQTTPDDSAWGNKLPTKDLVVLWQKDKRPEYTDELLKRMKPTISSAINSYSPGQEDTLAIKAAKLTLDALKTYSPAYGTDPSTHVFHTLKRLNRYGNERASIMPQPEGARLEAKRAQEIAAKFEDDRGREPSMAELADLTGYSVKKLDKLLNQNSTVPESATYAEGTTRTLLGKSDLTDDDYFEYVYSSASPIDQKIMEWTAGKHGKPQLSNNAIAAKLRISPAAVSQRKNTISRMLSEVRTLI